jgi:hypothetical protein
MSIKHFSNQPCPICQKDTMHFAMKCRDCGHINQTQYELRKKARVRHGYIVRHSKGGLKRAAENFKEHAKKRREEFQAMPYVGTTIRRESTFGKGRQNKKV